MLPILNVHGPKLLSAPLQRLDLQLGLSRIDILHVTPIIVDLFRKALPPILVTLPDHGG